MALTPKYMFLQMAKRYIKKSLVTKHQKMQIKMKERFHLTSISMAIVKIIIKDMCWQREKKLELLYITSRNVKWYSCYVKQDGGSLQIKNTLAM